MSWERIVEEVLRQAGLWASAVIFLVPLRKRAGNVWARGALCAVVGSALRLAAAAALAQGDVVLAAGVDAVVSYLAVLLLFSLCADLPVKAVFYCGLWTVMVYGLAENIGEMIRRVLEGFSPAAAAAAEAVFWCAALAAVGLTAARWMPDNRSYHTGPRQLTSAFLLWALFLGIDLFYMSGRMTAGWSGWVVMMLIQCHCATVLYLQHELFQKSAIRQELDMLNHLWLQHKNQYDLSKENITLINRKCHDLKHQIKAMRLLFTDESREKYLREMEQSVRIYEVLAKTGNEVLDTVLTEKSLYCEANGIQANCVADGRLLSFMDPVDLYTILGNALDNAIESVKENADREKRIIDVLIHAQKQMMLIQVMNPMNQELTFDEEGLPISTKEQNGYHGFGLKSIRHTVKKYGGFLTVRTDNGIFCLQILIPMPRQEEQK